MTDQHKAIATEAVNRMSQLYRNYVLLRYNEGMTHDEIALTLDKSREQIETIANLVEIRIRYALAKVRQEK